jgi:hypothetical protein
MWLVGKLDTKAATEATTAAAPVAPPVLIEAHTPSNGRVVSANARAQPSSVLLASGHGVLDDAARGQGRLSREANRLA